MLGYKKKSEGNEAKLVVLTGRNPQRYLEWEAQATHAIKSRAGKIGVEHWQGRHPYEIGERHEDSYAHTVREKHGDAKRAPSPVSDDYEHREHVALKRKREGDEDEREEAQKLAWSPRTAA